MLGVGLGQIASILTQYESRYLHIDPRQCSRLRHRKSMCTLCVDHCPAGAIVLEGTLKVDLDRCTGCGMCASACPTGALEAASPTNAELIHLMEQRKDTDRIAFACHKAVSRPDECVIQVSCLGRLDESVLVSAASYGIGQVLLIDGPCSNCANAIGHAVCARAKEESNALLNALGSNSRVAFTAQSPVVPSAEVSIAASGQVVSRRAFFSLLSRETRVATALAVSSALENTRESKAENKKGELTRRVPSKRTLLLEACQRLTRDARGDSWMQSNAWSTCLIKDTCNGCQMCAFFCPTGALRKTEHEGKPALSFRVGQCTNCQLCRDICFWKAIVLSPGMDLGKVLKDTSDILVFPQGAIGLESPDGKLKRLLQSIH